MTKSKSDNLSRKQTFAFQLDEGGSGQRSTDLETLRNDRGRDQLVRWNCEAKEMNNILITNSLFELRFETKSPTSFLKSITSQLTFLVQLIVCGLNERKNMLRLNL